MICCPFDTPEKQRAKCTFFVPIWADAKLGYCRFNNASDRALTDECRCAEREKEIDMMATKAYLAMEVKP